MQTTHSLTRKRLTLGELREFVAVFNGADDGTTVNVSVAPTSNMPTDPGGEITLSATVPARRP